LPCQFGGKFLRVVQIKKVLADRFCKGQSPKVQKRFVGIDKPGMAIEDVGKVRDGGERGVEDSKLPLDFGKQLQTILLGMGGKFGAEGFVAGFDGVQIREDRNSRRGELAEAH
jgi:hypothetical protein